MVELYFAYGSNMSSRRLAERISPLGVHGPARLLDHGLVYNKPGRDGSGKANLVPRVGTECWGVIWEVGALDWPTLDRHEPGYRREFKEVFDVAGSCLTAQVYLHAAAGPEITPFDWYLDHLLEGAREHRLPPRYVETLTRPALRR